MEKWYKSSWAISIGTAIFSLLLTMGYDYSKGEVILSTVWSLIKWIWRLILTILNFNLKVWWLIIAISLFILILYIIDNIKQAKLSKSDFLSYNKGTFKKWKWSWDWKYNNTQKAWNITKMQAHCPKCDTSMVDESSRSKYKLRFECPRCDFYATDNQCDVPYKIERIILDNIDRKKINKST